MHQEEILEHNIRILNCKTDKRAEQATKKVQNPTPQNRIFSGVKPTNNFLVKVIRKIRKKIIKK